MQFTTNIRFQAKSLGSIMDSFFCVCEIEGYGEHLKGRSQHSTTSKLQELNHCNYNIYICYNGGMIILLKEI